MSMQIRTSVSRQLVAVVAGVALAAVAQAAGPRVVKLKATDAMQYDVKRIEAKPGEPSLRPRNNLCWMRASLARKRAANWPGSLADAARRRDETPDPGRACRTLVRTPRTAS